jgi:hypothetical protein
LVLLLNRIGYKPPPPTSAFLENLRTKVNRAARQPNDVSTGEAKAALSYAVRRLEQLQDKSTKRVRRELSFIQKGLVFVSVGLGGMGLSVAKGAANEIGKTMVRHEIVHLVPAGANPEDVIVHVMTPAERRAILRAKAPTIKLE